MPQCEGGEDAISCERLLRVLRVCLAGWKGTAACHGLIEVYCGSKLALELPGSATD